jgi:RNA polymerase sigma-70 factor (ECF subfamily)
MTALPPFWKLVELHGDELMRYARKLVGDDAEDVAQEAFLRALRSYPRVASGDHLRAWLFRIATTTAFDHTSKRRRDGRLPVDRPEPGPDDPLEQQRFTELINGLTSSAQEALRLRFVDDLGYDDIATRLGCTPVAARQRVSTAVRALRKRLT